MQPPLPRINIGSFANWTGPHCCHHRRQTPHPHTRWRPMSVAVPPKHMESAKPLPTAFDRQWKAMAPNLSTLGSRPARRFEDFFLINATSVRPMQLLRQSCCQTLVARQERHCSCCCYCCCCCLCCCTHLNTKKLLKIWLLRLFITTAVMCKPIRSIVGDGTASRDKNYWCQFCP